MALLEQERDAAPQLTTPQPRPTNPLWQWVLERGVLYVLTGTPIVAIIGGIFYRIMPYPFLLISVLGSFVTLPIWISWRRRVSTNPDEPVHHLHKYALWALPPAAMFSVSRIPLHYTLGIIYWHPWYDFGNALTGTPLGRQDTLLVGGILNLIQGWAMGLGFYVLFKRHSLINVILYIAVWISALYSFDFATYSRVGLKSPPYWHASMAWAHFWMAMTLWFIPVFMARYWPKMRRNGRVGALTVAVLIVLAPSIFAQWRAYTWEFPRQTAIDNAAFERATLSVVPDSAAMVSTGADARYRFVLKFGPRDYHNWFKQLRSLDASGVQVSGTLSRDGQIIAWCTANVSQLPSANGITRPEAFAPVIKAVTYSEVPVSCVGPASAITVTRASTISIQWSAQMTLIGGRLRQVRQFNGQQSTSLGS